MMARIITTIKTTVRISKGLKNRELLRGGESDQSQMIELFTLTRKLGFPE